MIEVKVGSPSPFFGVLHCHRCGAKMRETDITPIGRKPTDPHDNFYFVHPVSDCRVKDYLIKIAYG